jgi:hypothetical protein
LRDVPLTEGLGVGGIDAKAIDMKFERRADLRNEAAKLL